MDFWRDYHRSPLFDENAVAGVHLIELLESLSRYPSHRLNFFSRMNQSLESLPLEWRAAATLIFSRTIYLPSEFLNDALAHLWNAARRRIGISNKPREIGEACHFFEIDPSGLLETFVHHNRIHQRLHPDYYARIFDINSLALYLSLLIHNEESFRKLASRDLLLLARKPFWLILSDKVLSGQSLISDLNRYLLFRRMVTDAIGVSPRIVVLAQVVTEDALRLIDYHFHKEGLDLADCIYAFKLGDELKVGAETCTLYRSTKQREMVVGFCKWFSDTYIVPDSRFATMIEKSNNDMSLGYRQSGLYFVDSRNAPTNSLPPIWYENSSLTEDERNGIPRYQGPYPRVHSRMGTQLITPSSSSGWETLENDFYQTIVSGIREAGHAKGD